MEIKLRMWNPHSKSYLYDIDNVFECLKQQHKFDGTMPDRGFVPEWDHRGEGMKWEMYTGLKDHSQKEAYKSDIVKHEYYGNGIVEWKDEDACFYINFGSPEYHMRISIISECNIIGNINENIELITK